jgi:DNA-binding MarR family transcriptional regulator
MATAPKFRETLTRLYQRFNALQRGEKRCFGVTMSQCVTSTVTRVVDVLVRDGLLRRARDEKRDRRRVFVSLTERGHRLAKQLEACSDAYCERILTRIPRDRREDVLHALRVLVDAIDELPGSC